MFKPHSAAAAIEKYAEDTYIQHNPHVPDGKDGLASTFKSLAKASPRKRAHFKRVVAKDHQVILQCRQE